MRIIFTLTKCDRRPLNLAKFAHLQCLEPYQYQLYYMFFRIYKTLRMFSKLLGLSNVHPL